jgi:Ca2+-binding EF-hand superfamily protein
LDEAFAKFDVDSSGEISKEEFIEALDGLGLTLSDEDALRIFAAIDHANSQQISYLEFVNAFNVDDTGMINKNMINRSSWQDSIIQMVANVLFQHRVQLLSAFRLFDLGNSGEISGDDFKTAMLTVNVLFPEPLSNAQISELKDALINSKSGKIDYRDFLESFQIVDVGWTNSVESSSLSREKRRRDSGYYNKK